MWVAAVGRVDPGGGASAVGGTAAEGGVSAEGVVAVRTGEGASVDAAGGSGRGHASLPPMAVGQGGPFGTAPGLRQRDGMPLNRVL